MKKGLKIWSKLLIASFFLGATVTSAVAQNGATTANCGTSLITVTRTANEVNAGTEITLNFSGTTETPIVAGDSYYFVAATGGSLLTVGCDNTIGANLQVVQVNGVDNAIAGDESPIVAAGTFADVDADDALDAITVKVKSVTPLADEATTLKLGVFVKDEATGCYSDVNWVTIQVLGNIYASLTLNGNNPYEYICHGATTSTNIGFTLCNLPDVTGTITAGTLNYTVTATPGTNITGQSFAATGNTGGSITGIGPWNAEISGIDAEATLTIGIGGGSLTYNNARTVEIGQQTLFNSNPSVAQNIVYSFSNMTYTYTDNGRTVVLPIVFETPNGKCHDRGIYDSTFTVYVAPNFRVQALAFKTADERTTHSTANPNLTYYEEANTALTEPTFCQGTLGYFRAINTTTEGTIAYAWTGTPTLDNDAIEAPTATVQFTDLTANAYALNVLATWNKDGNFGTGCQADTAMPITITPAPILLLATDKADMTDAGLADNAILWNTTDQITAPVVCPGQPVLIGTNETADFADDDAAARIAYMNAGNYIKANGATLSYTIDPLDNDNLKAYTDWRTTAAANGNLPLLQTDGATPGHFLNNQTNAQANITYTVQNADPNGCALVKKDGSALNLDQTNEGQVKIIFPVQPRPQFQLGAN